MTDRLALPLRYRDQIEALLREHVPGVEVWAYGSRVNGRSHDGSDLDLALRGPDLEPLDGGFYDLLEAIEKSNIPILVQAHDWATLPKSFHREIERDYVVLQKGPKQTSEGVAARDWLYHPHFPDDWDRRPLYSLAQWVNGLAFRNIQFSPTGKPVIKIAEIKSGISGQTKFTHQSFDESVRIRSGDLLFSWSGQPETSIDASWWHGPEGWLNQHIFRVTTDSDVYTTFFYYLLRYLKPNFVGIARNKQTTGLGHVTKRDLESIYVAIPPLPEQRAIAHVLGTLDDKIELNRRMNETLEGMARALFKSWFVDFEPVRAKMEGRWRRGESLPGLPADMYDLFPNRLVPSELGEIPEGWEVRKLGECYNLTMGQSPSGKTYNDDGEGMPFFQGRTDFGFRYPENRRYCSAPTRIARPDDTLVSVRAPVGAINMAWEQCCIGRGVAALRHNSGSTSFTYYSVWALQDEIQQYEHTGTVFGAITKSQFVALPVIEPGSATIRAFDSSARPLNERIKSNIAESSALAAQRDVLLPGLVSGEAGVTA